MYVINMSEKEGESRSGPKDFVLWVGGYAYSRESFEKEAERLGVCRRVKGFPSGLVVGKSRVFLVSDMAQEDREAYREEIKTRDRARYHMWIDAVRKKAVEKQLIPVDQKISYKEAQALYAEILDTFGEKVTVAITKPMPRGKPIVFAFFLVRGVSYIVGQGMDLPKELVNLGITKYEYEPGGFGFNDERGCGSLVIGGTYLLSEEDISKVKDLAESGTLGGRIVGFAREVQYKGARARALKAISQVAGDRLIRLGVPMEGV